MTYFEHMQRCAHEYFEALRAKHGGCVTAVAKEAGIARSTIYRLLRQTAVAPKRPRIRGNGEWRALQ